MKSLTIEHLQKTYFDPFADKQVTAIRDISLSVDAGDFVSWSGRRDAASRRCST